MAEAEAPPAPVPPTARELRSLFSTFKDAKDRWKIDAQTMKCYYLHTESGYLYIWDQPSGILHEFMQSTGQCQTVWSSAAPEINAGLWTVLPLPPTDPAALQAAAAPSNELPNIDTFIELDVTHESGKGVPADILEAAMDDFCTSLDLAPQARERLKVLPPAGQGYAMQTFRGRQAHDNIELSKKFIKHIGKLRRKDPPPWGDGACTLRVEATGAILGRCCADLDALCRDDPPGRLAQAHCKIMSEENRFFVSDMATSKDGTMLDGYAVHDDWVGPLKAGSVLTMGPLNIRIELSDMAKDEPLPGGRRPGKRSLEEEEENGVWQHKVYKKTGDEKERALRRQEEYKDRASERRHRCGEEPGTGNAAIDHLVNKFQEIKKAEEIAAEIEEQRVEMPTQEAQREANLDVDGSFVGFGGGMERAGIGFHAEQQNAELIPDVLDPKGLDQQTSSKMKMQMRFEQAHGDRKKR